MWKHWLLVALLCVLVAPVTAGEPAADHGVQAKGPTFVVYYFYAQPRCPTCRAIEADTGTIVKKHFAAELENGIVTWKTVDVGQPENKHFIQDFKLYTKSVVLVEKRDGKIVRHEILQKVWELIHQPDRFEDYVVKSVQDFMLAGVDG